MWGVVHENRSYSSNVRQHSGALLSNNPKNQNMLQGLERSELTERVRQEVEDPSSNPDPARHVLVSCSWDTTCVNIQDAQKQIQFESRTEKKGFRWTTDCKWELDHVSVMSSIENGKWSQFNLQFFVFYLAIGTPPCWNHRRQYAVIDSSQSESAFLWQPLRTIRSKLVKSSH